MQQRSGDSPSAVVVTSSELTESCSPEMPEVETRFLNSERCGRLPVGQSCFSGSPLNRLLGWTCDYVTLRQSKLGKEYEKVRK
ncbi:MAG: hypothetical protein U1F27_06085 [Turneriella sp.]